MPLLYVHIGMLCLHIILFFLGGGLLIYQIFGLFYPYILVFLIGHKPKKTMYLVRVVGASKLSKKKGSEGW